jgi:hypothetical protein
MASSPPEITGQEQTAIKQLRTELLDEIRKSKSKDTWDKFSSLSPFLTALIVAILGGWFNHIQDNRNTVLKQQEDSRISVQKQQEDARQRESQVQAAQLQKLQTIGQFMPYLTSEDERKQKVAITAIRTVGGIELAIEVAVTNDTPGTREALAALAKNADNKKDRDAAQTALNQLRGDVLVTSEGECGPSGSGGDEIMNVLKNRVDVPSQYQNVAVDRIEALGNPEVPRFRRDWRPEQKDELTRLGDGKATSVEGYLVKVTKSLGESSNCKFKGVQDVNWSLSIAQDPAANRGLIAVISPRARVVHRNWNFPELRQLATSKEKIRVSGWLIYDSGHRSSVSLLPTAWRISPVTEIEVFRDGKWMPVDGTQ